LQVLSVSRLNPAEVTGPAQSVNALLATMLFRSVSSPIWSPAVTFIKPPPWALHGGPLVQLTVFPLTVLFVTARRPRAVFKMPPACASFPFAAFPLTVLLWIVSLPKLTRPPPEAKHPDGSGHVAVFPLTVLL